MKPNPYTDVATFLAYSLVIEQEAAERLGELADSMEVHHHHQAAQLLFKLQFYSEQHVNEVGEIANQYVLPELRPWDYQWPGQEPPETLAYADFNYQMSVQQVLQLARKVETSAAGFYQEIADNSHQEQVKLLAASFAAEEWEHVAAVEKLMAENSGVEPADQQVDWDPPVMPE